jgi:hypothetical protein
MAHPRVLIPIGLQFSVRYLLRTGLLSSLAEFCEPVLLLGWDDEALEAELADCGYEVHHAAKAQWGGEYERARGFVNFCHQVRMASPSTAIRERRADLDRSLSVRLRRRAHKMLHRASLLVPGAESRARRDEERLFWSGTNAPAIDEQIGRLHLDAVFCITPFLVDEEAVLRACARRGIPMCTAILSFDNLTTRPWMPLTFHTYLLWNRHNADQLRRGYPEAAGSRIEVVGSPQFDFYHDRSYVWDESDWRARLGLPDGGPVILFGGGFFSCAPHEPQFLEQLDNAIESGEIARDAVILFRRHPVDPIGRWTPILNRARHVVHDDPWTLGKRVLGHTNLRRADIEKLASTLHHSAVHVNVASTMTVDGAIYDRPQVGPAYDDSPGGKYHRAALECYLQEHYLPVVNSGGVDIVTSRERLIASVRTALENPGRLTSGRRRLVQEICTFDDGRSTARVADAAAAFLGKSCVQGATESANQTARSR